MLLEQGQTDKSNELIIPRLAPRFVSIVLSRILYYNFTIFNIRTKLTKK